MQQGNSCACSMCDAATYNAVLHANAMMLHNRFQRDSTLCHQFAIICHHLSPFVMIYHQCAIGACRSGGHASLCGLPHHLWPCSSAVHQPFWCLLAALGPRNHTHSGHALPMPPACCTCCCCCDSGYAVTSITPTIFLLNTFAAVLTYARFDHPVLMD